MEILVKVQIELSDATKQFVEGLLGKQSSAEKIIPKEVQIEKTTKADTQLAVKTETKSATKTETAQKTTSAISIEEVRKLLASKVNDHRSAIKAKLTELGAANVTTLAEEKYDVFYSYLKSLEDAK